MGRVRFYLSVLVIGLLSLTASSLFFGETAKAQGVTRFDTYGEALDNLLGIGVERDGGPGGAGKVPCRLLPSDTDTQRADTSALTHTGDSH